MTEIHFLSLAELEEGLAPIRQSPHDSGTLSMIVRRPEVNQREVLEVGELDEKEGLKGDNWATRGSSRTPDKTAHPEMQLNLMNARAIALIAQSEARWPLAGDQLYVDLNLSEENLPPGTRLSLGEAIIEITAIPHNGCKKFAQRFGVDAVKFVNSKEGKALHLRGLNARVIRGGRIQQGDIIQKC